MNKWIRYSLIALSISLLTLAFLYFSKETITQKELDTYSNYVKEGDKYYEVREYANAIYQYSLAADTIQTKLDAYEGIVNILIDKNQLDQASELLDKSVSKLSGEDRAVLHLKVGDGYYSNKDYDKAEKYYLNSYKAKSNIDAILGLAKTYIMKDEIDKSEKYLNKVKEVESEKTLDAFLLKAYLEYTNVEEAKKYTDEVETSMFENSDILDRYNSYINAITTYDGDNLYLSALLAKEYIDAGFPILAIKILDKVSDDIEEYPDGLYLLGRAYYDCGNSTKAIETMNKALALGSYTGEIYQVIVRSLLSLGNQKDSFDYYEKAIEFAEDAKKLELMEEYIDLLLDEGLYTKAKTYLEKYVLISDEVWPLLKYVEMYYLQRDFDKMSYHLGEISKLSDLTDSEKKDLYKWEIIYDLENGEYVRARENLKKLKDLDRFNSEYYLLLGKVDLAENKPDNAKTNLEKAIDYDLTGEYSSSAKKILDRIE